MEQTHQDLLFLLGIGHQQLFKLALGQNDYLPELVHIQADQFLSLFIHHRCLRVLKDRNVFLSP